MKRLCFWLLLLLVLSACTLPAVQHEPTETPTPEPTETPEPTPVPTAPPYYAIADGVYVRIDDTDEETQRIRDAYETEGVQVPDDAALHAEALDVLIDEALFLAEAQRRGLVPSDAELDERIASLSEKSGGEAALRDWQNRSHYSEESFRRALERQAAAENMKAVLLEERLPGVTYYHVYRMSSPLRSDLTGMLEKLNMGVSFIQLAADWEEGAGGDMSWITKGVLLVPEIEQAVFSLEPGHYTDIIEYNERYNLFFLAEKQNGRETDTQVRRTAEHNVLTDWLAERKAEAEIIRN